MMDKHALMMNRLAEVRVRFRDRVVDNCAEIREAAAKMGDGEKSAELRERIRRLAHSLAGTAGTFGFKAISEAAALLEDRIDAGISDRELTELSHDVAALMESRLAEAPGAMAL